ncbi:hypothetical protein P7L70_11735 [Tistrella mobilis]|uniref:hypothetical protein n=1 Tax=Tistrella mobilis TaxID=171437 RepID=UPI003555F465
MADMIVVDTLADLLAIPAGWRGPAQILGRNVVNDGGGGVFQWDAASTATPNRGTVFQPTAGGTGRWIRIWSAIADLPWFIRAADGSASPGLAAALEVADVVRVPVGSWSLADMHVLEGKRLIGDGMGLSVLTLANTAAGVTLSGQVDGTGISGLTIDGGQLTDTTGASGLVFRNARHSRVENVEIRALPAGTGFDFVNVADGFNESNILIGIRATDCGWGLRFRRAAGSTADSFYYNTIIGTVSLMPEGGTGLAVESVTDGGTTRFSVLSGAFVRLNVYGNVAAGSRVVDIGGRVTSSALFVTGEAASGSTAHTTLRLGPAAHFRENTGQITYVNGKIEIAPDTTIVNNKVLLQAGTDVRVLETATGGEEMLKLNIQVPADGAWKSLVNISDDDADKKWVKVFDRPSPPVSGEQMVGGKFVTVVAGCYRISTNLLLTGITAGQRVEVHAVKSGSSLSDAGIRLLIDDRVANADGVLVVSGDVSDRLAAGEEVWLEMRVTGGGAVEIDANTMVGTDEVTGSTWSMICLGS